MQGALCSKPSTGGSSEGPANTGPGVVVYACNLSTGERKQEEQEFMTSPGLQNEFEGSRHHQSKTTFQKETSTQCNSFRTGKVMRVYQVCIKKRGMKGGD